MMNHGNADVGKRVLYTCSYVPEEIILASGLVPKRMIPRSRPSEADAYMHPNTCHYVKSLLASGLAEDNAGTGAVVIANSCDGMRRLHDLWKGCIPNTPALFLDVPKKSDSASIDFFGSELQGFVKNLEDTIPGANFEQANLEEAISVCNNQRLLMEEVFRLQKDESSNVSGMAVFNLCLGATDSSPIEFAEKLREFISDPGDDMVSAGGTRIILTGNFVHRPDLIELVENAGSRVVLLDTCTGARHYDTLVKENSSDPLQALSERYLTKASCARMEGIAERTRRLKQLATDCLADGIIYTMVKFCDSHLYDVPFMQEEFRKAGIPFLFLENDYEWSGLGQMKTRVEAFLSMAGERGAKEHAQGNA